MTVEWGVSHTFCLAQERVCNGWILATSRSSVVEIIALWWFSRYRKCTPFGCVWGVCCFLSRETGHMVLELRTTVLQQRPLPWMTCNKSMSLHLPVLLPVRQSANHKRPPGAPALARPNGKTDRLIDSCGRTITDLRLSVTDRCNFRCVYCMEPDVRFLPKRQLLQAEELVRLAQICAGLGVNKIRLTGGEPLVYPELDSVIRGISTIHPRPDLALTTNGSLLDRSRLEALRCAGLSRITISIDSMAPERFAAITRSTGTPDKVLQAIDASLSAGLSPVRVNAVVVRGWNEDEVPALAGIARTLGIDMRFIEFMPLDSGRAWDRSRLVPAQEILTRIAETFPLVPAGRDDPSSTASLYTFADGAPGRIGIIASVTRPFCNQCSRLRITADGKVRPCLFSNQEWDLRPLFLDKANDDQIADFLVDATWTKQAGHGISSTDFVQPDRHMAAIGG